MTLDAHSIPLHRRLIGMTYDFMIAGFIALFFAFIISSVLASRDITIEPDSPLSQVIFGIELLIGLLYMLWFILRKQQTPGMWVWKLKMANKLGDAPSIGQITIRYTVLMGLMFAGFMLGSQLLGLSSFAALGLAILLVMLGVAVSYFSPGKQALHEILSGTRLVDTKR